MAGLIRSERQGGVVFLTFDDPERPVNTLGTAAIRDFERVLAELEGGSGVEGAVLLSAKPRTFLAGADLKELEGLDDAARAAAWVGRGQELLGRWRRLPFPTVAAIGGAALGGGLEVALACTWRVATDQPATTLGLPEVRLGLIPALGGTFELPRLVGLERGVELLVTGRQLGARQALAARLVDEVVAPGDLREAALRWIGRGARRRTTPWRERLLAGNPLGRKLFFGAARRRVLAKTGGHYPAPLAILEAVETGRARGESAALVAERRAFGELAVGPVSRNLVSLFLTGRRLAAGAEPVARPIATLGIVGAGFMGSGIAAAAARVGCRVRLVDQSPASLERGLEFCRRRFADLAARQRLSEAEAAAAMARIVPGTEPEDFGDCELVIEAVFEDLDLKQRVFAELETVMSPTAVLGSNTSTLPITRLAEELDRPERMLGIHFFSPVHRMPLVELIRHPGTGDEAVAAARALAGALGKTPIVVRDGPGFYTSRILAPYLAQGATLLLEGFAIEQVDAAARGAGFPVGPLELLDEVGLDVAARAAATLAAAFPHRLPAPGAFGRLVEAGRTGRKGGRGFYDYGGPRKRPDPALYGLLDGRRPVPGAADLAALGERLLLAMAAEAVRCLQDGILDDPRHGDVGAVLGLGFPPFRGGPFRYLDSVGASPAIERLETLAARHGAVFEPPQLLRQKSLRGDGFHPA